MNKDNILYGTIGLLIGLIIGYLVTNSINRSALVSAPPAAASAAPGSSSALPPDHPPVGSAAASGGAMPEVTATLEKARNNPSDFDAQMQAANLYNQIQRHEQELEFLERAHKLKPNDYEVIVKLGNANFDLERWVEAEKWYQMALKIKPADVNVRTDLGLSYYSRQPPELDKAIAAYRVSLSYNPRHEITLQNLTQALIDKKDTAAARETLKQLEQVNPNNQALPRLRAQIEAP
jgi:tetratricopeptide (TPR) repeat protein